MRNQLALLDEQPDWRLDERTREVGLKGVRRAREALRRHSPATGGDDPPPERDGPLAAGRAA